MNYAIVYSSRTGNTKLLAEAIRETLPAEDCVYFGTPSPKALSADRLYVGFWTDKGCCDADTAAFLEAVTEQQIFLFGTAGFGISGAYFEKILKQTGRHLHGDPKVIGSFMCQGRMPLQVRKRYEAMQEAPDKVPNISQLLKNFDQALSHPDESDLAALKNAVLTAL